ncbi:uncharacterized protein ACR2FA_004971 [Aphomia sociella]
MPKDKLRVTDAQNNLLCRFFEDNPEVIKGYKKTSKHIEAVQTKWKKIAPQLNTLGPSRDYKAWAKYLCDLKAKLKRKRIKWSQKSNGTGPIICNAADFSEIKIRMLQVLKESLNAQDTQESHTSDADLDEETKLEHNDDDSYEETYPWHESDNKTSSTQHQNSSYIKLPTESSTTVPQVFTNLNENGDEFDTFGKNIAQQLRTLPLPVALETQEMLLAVVRKQRLRALSYYNTIDPLDK